MASPTTEEYSNSNDSVHDKVPDGKVRLGHARAVLTGQNRVHVVCHKPQASARPALLLVLGSK